MGKKSRNLLMKKVLWVKNKKFTNNKKL